MAQGDFFECVDNFLIQMIKEPTKNGALLDLILTNKAELVVDVGVRCKLACTDREMMACKILTGGSEAKCRAAILNLWEQTSASSEICLEESHGIQPWRERTSM